MRSGNIYTGNDSLKYAGYGGNYWSSRAASNIWGGTGFGARYLGFDASGATPSSGPAERWFGFPLRGLAGFTQWRE